MMKKYIWQIILLIGLVALLFSCSRDLHTGRYVVERANGRLIELKGVNNYYYFDTDTLKVNDTVFVQRTFKKSKANIY